MGRERGEKRRSRHSSASETTGDSAEDSSGSSSEDDDRRKSKKSRRVSSDRSKTKRRSSKHSKRRHKDTKSHKPKFTLEVISASDYFLKSSEFRAWLADERGVFFSDLTSETSRKLFDKFVKRWNAGRLKKRYYQGIHSSSLSHDSQTQYKWKFASRLDEKQMMSMRENVTSWTTQEEMGGASGGGASGTRNTVIGPTLPGQSSSPAIGPVQGPARPPSDAFEVTYKREDERERVTRGRKEMRKHHEMVMDELLPKATGRQAMIEKKKARTEQRRARDVSPDVKDSTLMGSSDDIGRKIQVRHKQRQHRAQAAHQKISDYQAKEKERVAAILEMAKANKKEGSLW